MLRISYKDHVTNEKVRAKIQQAIGPHEDLLTIGKRRKLVGALSPVNHRRLHQGWKEMETAVVWSCLQFIRSGQNHLVGNNEREKKTRQTEEEVGRQHQGMDRPGVRQVPEHSGEQGKLEEIGCEMICGAQTTLMVKR